MSARDKDKTQGNSPGNSSRPLDENQALLETLELQHKVSEELVRIHQLLVLLDERVEELRKSVDTITEVVWGRVDSSKSLVSRLASLETECRQILDWFRDITRHTPAAESKEKTESPNTKFVLAVVGVVSAVVAGAFEIVKLAIDRVLKGP